MNNEQIKASSGLTKRWISINEAAEYLGVSPLTIRNWAKTGKVTLHNVTLMGTRGRVFIDRYKLDALIESYAGAEPSALVMNEKRKKMGLPK